MFRNSFRRQTGNRDEIMKNIVHVWWLLLNGWVIALLVYHYYDRLSDLWPTLTFYAVCTPDQQAYRTRDIWARTCDERALAPEDVSRYSIWNLRVKIVDYCWKAANRTFSYDVKNVQQKDFAHIKIIKKTHTQKIYVVDCHFSSAIFKTYATCRIFMYSVCQQRVHLEQESTTFWQWNSSRKSPLFINFLCLTFVILKQAKKDIQLTVYYINSIHMCLLFWNGLLIFFVIELNNI